MDAETAASPDGGRPGAQAKEGLRSAVLEAMLVELAEKGYAEASVANVARAGGLSEAEFAAQFGDKDSCMFAAYDKLSEDLVRTCGSCGGEGEWPARVRGGLAALLAAIAAEPAKARVATRVFPAIRPTAYKRYTDLVSSFVPFVREGRSYSEIGEELPDEVELLAVGAAEALIFTEVDAGRAERLPEMMPEILFSVLVPFIGPDRAAEEMQDAMAAR